MNRLEHVGERIHGWRGVASVALFPALLGGCVAAGLGGIHAGVWPALLPVALAPIVVTVVLLAERWLPHREEWRPGGAAIRTDMAHLVVSAVLLPPLIRWLISVLLLPAAAWISSSAGAGWWPTGWPLMAQLLLALVLTDFTDYWVHRLAHQVPFLWRFHEVHHEPEHLYSLNSSRVHPFEVLWGHSVDMAPLIILGCGLEAMTLWTIFHGVIIFCAHANVDFRTGFLAWIVNTPELHRWHHSKNLQEANSNYSGNLVLWDIVFGTRRLPKRGAAEVGLSSPSRIPKDYLGQLTAPFQRRPVGNAATRLQARDHPSCWAADHPAGRHPDPASEGEQPGSGKPTASSDGIGVECTERDTASR